ncbi:MAG: bifunctional folylpolyglutamate synthase/dihydrofolate synthase [Acidimicrobiales bacterium]|nr:bifunctional folylpolyglutamate synthase/dihydrofolate synthase [Acidimicrobiales bacterium]
MNLTAALRYLDEHTNLEATAGRAEGLSLDRMRSLVSALGDPQDAYPVIHLTGTNGKGSVARMVTELLRASGLSVGTYTSPHLERINERIAWDGVPIPDDELGRVIGSVAAVESVAGVTPSYFEILTAAAFTWFADNAVDVAVVEVGMLGRYDATNVANGAVAVLTNVGHDHTDGVGAWRQAIAEEKVGIVKPGATFVCGETDDDLRPILDTSPAESTWLRGRDFDCDQAILAVGGRVLDLRTPSGVVEDLYLPLHGAHQADNAAAALAAVEAFFGRQLAEPVVREGFAAVTSPGRFEIAGREPTVVLDAAHNVDGARACRRTLEEEFTLAGSVIVVVGMLGGRDPAEMLTELGATEAGFLIACTPDSPRAIPAPELAAVATSLGIVAESIPSVEDALERALALATPDDLVLVTGSLYVVGPARSALAREVEA